MEVEAIALVFAINWVRQMHLRDIVVEIDCKQLHDAILSCSRSSSRL